ncbi:MAG: hypothetical protein KBF19_07245 [Negativicutes bacterium]|nr:hypothetical protein [Negativicutes bacterium]
MADSSSRKENHTLSGDWLQELSGQILVRANLDLIDMPLKIQNERDAIDQNKDLLNSSFFANMANLGASLSFADDRILTNMGNPTRVASDGSRVIARMTPTSFEEGNPPLVLKPPFGVPLAFADNGSSGVGLWSESSTPYNRLQRNLETYRELHLGFLRDQSGAYLYDAYQATDAIAKYTDAITRESSATGVPENLIRAILFREQIFYSVVDATDQSRVRIGLSASASVGLAQIFPETAYWAERVIVNGAPATELQKEYEAKIMGSQMRKVLLQKLENNEENIHYAALILAAEAKKLEIDLSTATEWQLQQVLAAYNGSGQEAQRYGVETFEYYNAYRRYYQSQ